MKVNSKSEPNLSPLSLSVMTILAIILLEGFVTISIEMLTIRQLVPVLGNSVIITSIIIGIFLLFLALGYHRGGQYQENYEQILKSNFTWTAILLGIGLSYYFVQLLFLFIYNIIAPNALLALMIYLLLITAPLSYILGQTVPITTNLFKYEHHVGSISGKVLCLSTLGSFLGSILTTLVLMNFLGVAWTIMINFMILSALILLLVPNFSAEKMRLMVLSLCGIFILFLNVGFENLFLIRTNNYGDYAIVKNVPSSPQVYGTLLSINNSYTSYLTPEKKSFGYIELIKRILFIDLNLQNKDILVLGAGGFTLSAETDYGNHFFYVDIDKDIINIVKKGFIDKINGQFIAEDARKFLINTRQHFDVVVSDVYSNNHIIPFHLLTKEYFQDVRHVIKNNGVAIFNIIASPLLQDIYSKRVDNTIRSVFANCMTIPLKYSGQPTNIIYICYPKASSVKDNTIYTDNLNSATLDFFNQQAK